MKLNNPEMEKYLREGASQLGVTLDSGQISQYLLYIEELKKWSKRINLTALKDDRDIVVRHFLDSLIPLRYIKDVETILDIGTGAGFPGLVLKVACPDLRLTLLEPTGKKTHFLRHIVRTLGLEGVEVVNGRAEDKAIIEKNAKSFDCVISRALSELATFYSWAEPYIGEGGTIVAMKGPLDGKLDAELKEIEGAEPRVEEIDIPFSDRKTAIVVFPVATS